MKVSTFSLFEYKLKHYLVQKYFFASIFPKNQVTFSNLLGVSKDKKLD